MWSKIKKIFSVIGVAFSALFVALFCRSRANGRRGTDDSGGLEQCKNRLADCERGLEESTGTIRDCENLHETIDGRLYRAEQILRKATERSKVGKNNNSSN